MKQSAKATDAANAVLEMIKRTFCANTFNCPSPYGGYVLLMHLLYFVAKRLKVCLHFMSRGARHVGNTKLNFTGISVL